MAEIKPIHPRVKFSVTITCGESELRALDALAGYGDDAFIEAFYEKLGRAYMEAHEKGLREFLKSIRDTVPGVISKIDAAKKQLGELSDT